MVMVMCSECYVSTSPRIQAEEGKFTASQTLLTAAGWKQPKCPCSKGTGRPAPSGAQSLPRVATEPLRRG